MNTTTKNLVTCLTELSQKLAELTKAIEDEIAENVETISKDTAKTPTQEPEISIEDVRAILAEKSQNGLTEKVKDLITSFDADKLSDVDPARFPELLEAVKKLK